MEYFEALGMAGDTIRYPRLRLPGQSGVCSHIGTCYIGGHVSSAIELNKESWYNIISMCKIGDNRLS